MFLSKLQNSSRSPEVSVAEPWGSVRSTLRTYALVHQTLSLGIIARLILSYLQKHHWLVN